MSCVIVHGMSQTRRIVDALLRDNYIGMPLDDYLADRRDPQRPGGRMSWASIAEDLAELTDGIVSVSWMTVRRWSNEEAAA